MFSPPEHAAADFKNCADLEGGESPPVSSLSSYSPQHRRMSSPTHGPPATPVRTRNSAELMSQTPTPTTLTASTRKRHCELIASALGEHVNGRKKQKK